MSNLLIEAEKHLRLNGGRMTTQRRRILQALEQMPDHPTAEDIYTFARQTDPGLNLSTVYRTLRWLQETDLVQSRFFEENRRHERFDPVVIPEEHHHFMCTSCSQVFEFETQLVDRMKIHFEECSGAEVHSGTFILYGLCLECRNLGGN
jgi:Fe2+ or Zn2+ uptake regulation protein